MKKARYIRQSTAQQSNLRQMAKAHPDEILFIDTISGSVPFNERPQGRRLMEAVEAGEINYVSYHAIDRCGRSTINVLQTLQYFYDKSVVVKIDNLGLESMINGKANPVFNLITTILSELSSLEKSSLLERQAEGIAQSKLRGVYKGRVKGTTDSAEETLLKHKRVVKSLKTNPTLSLRQIAKLASDNDYKVSANTVKKVVSILQKQN
ncbi:recombinase family protein [Flavobacterium tyrosinilyticum]|uniref:recombinase family protein n=1 Tax=Flavobacterium tyrosinilyticum TaxID=1658740 RepID=UPI00202F66F9|nr:recombinase family protein [Flavobacterium tyrosinilyticum]MCM0666393.1 recombinase family protein [Flavobacterium tyrosinilyticum]